MSASLWLSKFVTWFELVCGLFDGGLLICMIGLFGLVWKGGGFHGFGIFWLGWNFSYLG